MNFQINVKIFKNKKTYEYVIILIDWWWFKFHTFYCHLILHQESSKFCTIYNGYNLMVFDGLSNDNEIIWNLNHHQYISIRIYS
jgi:hypothetical protein